MNEDFKVVNEAFDSGFCFVEFFYVSFPAVVAGDFHGLLFAWKMEMDFAEVD